jgi:hypothetical protein
VFIHYSKKFKGVSISRKECTAVILGKIKQILQDSITSMRSRKAQRHAGIIILKHQAEP